MVGAMIRAAERGWAIRITTFEQQQLDVLRMALGKDYEAEIGLPGSRSAVDPQARFSSSLGT